MYKGRVSTKALGDLTFDLILGLGSIILSSCCLSCSKIRTITDQRKHKADCSENEIDRWMAGWMDGWFH